MKLLPIALAAAGILNSAPAAATLVPSTVFEFTVSGGASGYGTLQATDEGSYYMVTGISGVFNGNTIGSIVPPSQAYGTDEVLFYPATPHLSSAGIAFTAGGYTQEIWYNYAMQTYRSFPVGSGPVVSVDFDIQTPGVPEPATWAMLTSGFGLVGAAVRRRPNRTIQAV